MGRGQAQAARTRFRRLLEARPEHLEAALRLAELERRT